MKTGNLLIVDDNKNVLTALTILLRNHFLEVNILSSPNTLIKTIQEKNPDVILLDMNYSAGINTGNEGLFWLNEIKKIEPDIPIVLFTAYADIELAVKALKEGATDFIVKPWDNAKLIATLQAALSLRISKNKIKKLEEKQSVLNESLTKHENICWGKSKAMKELLSIIEKVARTDANVLITGENGTGKEMIAKIIHQLSPRSKETMVTVDMGAVTESLFESELFGSVKGAFTDAKTDRAGKIEAADKGSLFLDEIGNLSYLLQAKLLSVLQSRLITRVGSNKPIPVDIRLICATNRDLNKAVENGEFREDLLYRINTIQVEVPALRNRKEDIKELTDFFLVQFSKKYNKGNLELTAEAIKKLESYSWPGNVRELQHTIEKAVILSDNAKLTEADFYLNNKKENSPSAEIIPLEEMEKILIEKALKKYENNISFVANELGISRPTLYNKMKKYKLG